MHHLWVDHTAIEMMQPEVAGHLLGKRGAAAAAAAVP